MVLHSVMNTESDDRSCVKNRSIVSFRKIQHFKIFTGSVLTPC